MTPDHEDDPPMKRDTDPAPAGHDRTDEILSRMDDLRRELVERDRAMANHLLAFDRRIQQATAELAAIGTFQQATQELVEESRAEVLARLGGLSSELSDTRAATLSALTAFGQQVSGVHELAKSAYDVATEIKAGVASTYDATLSLTRTRKAEDHGLNAASRKPPGGE